METIYRRQQAKQHGLSFSRKVLIVNGICFTSIGIASFLPVIQKIILSHESVAGENNLISCFKIRDRHDIYDTDHDVYFQDNRYAIAHSTLTSQMIGIGIYSIVLSIKQIDCKQCV